ncbi:MAG: flagellar biosynthesis protein FlhF [Spirochaetaceae bacterium]|nr:MAG: flagellar biosynthesis protein FlhF [Spirochaetaceae bacterium]
MEYFVEQAASHREAESKIRSKYGDKARIMHHKTIRTGGFLGFFTREGVEVTGYFSHEPSKPRPDAARKNADIEEEKRKILGSVKSDKTIDMVLKELQTIKEKMDQPQPAVTARSGDHPTLVRMQELLLHNEFTPSYIAQMIRRLRSGFSLEELEDSDRVEAQLVEWIAETIRIHEPRRTGPPDVFVLVGPTGVGKTTTIAKLAAMHGVESDGNASPRVRIITIDNYRIGAREQIETYGNIMDIPVACVDSAQEMRKQVALFQDADVVFVDTIGKSPRQFSQLGEMNEVVRACGGGAQVHLAISATTKTSDLYEVLRQFEPFGYRSIIVTKLDETTRIGNVISVLHDKQKPISYLTDGQRVPENLERATVERLLLTLEELHVNRRRIAEAFANPNDGASNG